MVCRSLGPQLQVNVGVVVSSGGIHRTAVIRCVSVPTTSLQLLHGSVIFNLGKTIPSAEAAAAIKFGVEKVSGVCKVHFVGDDIEVVFDAEGAAIGLIVDVLAEAGFPSATAAGVKSLAQESTLGEIVPYPPPAADADEEGAAIA